MDVVYLCFREAFNTDSHNILVSKQGCYDLDGPLKTGWMLGLKGWELMGLQGLIPGLILLHIFINDPEEAPLIAH